MPELVYYLCGCGTARGGSYLTGILTSLFSARRAGITWPAIICTPDEGYFLHFRRLAQLESELGYSVERISWAGSSSPFSRYHSAYAQKIEALDELRRGLRVRQFIFLDGDTLIHSDELTRQPASFFVHFHTWTVRDVVNRFQSWLEKLGGLDGEESAAEGDNVDGWPATVIREAAWGYQHHSEEAPAINTGVFGGDFGDFRYAEFFSEWLRLTVRGDETNIWISDEGAAQILLLDDDRHAWMSVLAPRFNASFHLEGETATQEQRVVTHYHGRRFLESEAWKASLLELSGKLPDPALLSPPYLPAC